MLASIAVALAGRAGARLADRLGMPTSRDSLLRLLRGLPDVQVTALPMLGVDLSRPCGYPERFPSSRRKPCSGRASVS